METIKSIKQRFDTLNLAGFKNETGIKNAVQKVNILFDIKTQKNNFILIAKDAFDEDIVQKALEPFEELDKSIVLHRPSETCAIKIETAGQTFSGLIKELHRNTKRKKDAIPIQKLKEIPKSIELFFTENGIEAEGNSDEEIDAFLKDKSEEDLEAIAYIMAQQRRGKTVPSDKKVKLLKKLFDVKIIKLKESGKSLILIVKKQHVPKAAVFACLPLLNDLFKPISIEENGAAFLMRASSKRTAMELYRLLSPLKRPETKIAAHLLGPKQDLPKDIKKAVQKFPKPMEKDNEFDMDELETLKKGFGLYSLSNSKLNCLFVLNEKASAETQENAFETIPTTYEKGLGEGSLVLNLPEQIRTRIFPEKKRQKNILESDIKDFESLPFMETDEEHFYEMPLTLEATKVYLLNHYGGFKIKNDRLLFHPLPEYQEEWQAFKRPQKKEEKPQQPLDEMQLLMQKVAFTITHTDENGNIWFTVDKKEPLSEGEEHILSAFSKGVLNSYEVPDLTAVVKKATGTQSLKVEDLTKYFYIQRTDHENVYTFAAKEPTLSDFEKIKLQGMLEQHILLPKEIELKDENVIIGTVRFKDEEKAFMRISENTAQKWLEEKLARIDDTLENRYELTENDKLYLARRLRGEQIIIPDERHMLPLSDKLISMINQNKAEAVSAPVTISSSDLIKRFKNGRDVLQMSNQAKEEAANMLAIRIQKHLEKTKAA